MDPELDEDGLPKRQNPFSNAISDYTPPRYGDMYQQRLRDEAVADRYTIPSQQSGAAIQSKDARDYANDPGRPQGPPSTAYQSPPPQSGPGQPMPVSGLQKGDSGISPPGLMDDQAGPNEQFAQQANPRRNPDLINPQPGDFQGGTQGPTTPIQAVTNPDPMIKKRIGEYEQQMQFVQQDPTGSPWQKQHVLNKINKKMDALDPHRLYRKESMGNQMTKGQKAEAEFGVRQPDGSLVMYEPLKSGGFKPHVVHQAKSQDTPDHIKPVTADQYLRHREHYEKLHPEAPIDEVDAYMDHMLNHAHSRLPQNQPGVNHPGAPVATMTPPAPRPPQSKSLHQIQEETKAKHEAAQREKEAKDDYLKVYQHLITEKEVPGEPGPDGKAKTHKVKEYPSHDDVAAFMKERDKRMHPEPYKGLGYSSGEQYQPPARKPSELTGLSDDEALKAVKGGPTPPRPREPQPTMDDLNRRIPFDIGSGW